MLGWEFPPEISGGLGIANYNLCKALAPMIDLTLILPRNDPELLLENVEIIDLSKLKIQEIFEKEELIEFEETVKERKIEFSFSPYPVKEEKVSDKTIKVPKRVRTKKIVEIHNLFSTSDLYGLDLLDKVNYYEELVLRVASTLSFDIIHVHDWMTCQSGIRLKEEFKKPLILHIHSLNYDRLGPDKMGWIYQTEKKALRKSDIIIPVSQYTGNIIHEFYKIRNNKIFPVHNGVEKVNIYRSKKNFNEKLVLFMGRITMQKGPEYFLEAASQVLDKFSTVRFAVAGDGDKLQEIIEFGSYPELSGKIHFTGFLKRPEVHYMLSIADVFCMPSVSEPFGIAALEAAQFGIPMVISSRSGAAEVLSGALTVDFWDTKKMADLIIELLTNRKLYRKCVAQGHKDLKELTWENSAQKVVAIYNRLLPA